MVTNLRVRGRRRPGTAERVAITIGSIVAIALPGLGAVPASAVAGLRPLPPASAFGRRPGKLSPRLNALATGQSFASARAESAALSLPASGPGSLVRKPGGRVLVEIRASTTTTSAVRVLRALGADIVNVSPAYSTVTASVAPRALNAIAAAPDVTYVSEVLAPLTVPSVARPDATPAPEAEPALSVCHPTTSEGDALMSVATARAADGVDGSGQTIGILSDSYDTDAAAPTHAAGDVASGDLPGLGNPCGYPTPVDVQADFSGGGQTDEGRAMAELAHALAPGARLAFATASNGEFDFAKEITTLRTVDKASVIVDDATYFDEPFFQDGPIASAANAASAAGVPYFSAAGNSNVIVGGKNVSSYETPSFRSTACPASVTSLEPLLGCHNFDTSGGTDNSDDITLAPGGGFALDLQWAQPWGAVSNDYDVFLLSSTGAVVVDSAVDQSLFQEPFEFFGYTNATGSAQTVQVVIAKFSGATDSRMKFALVDATGITAVQYNTSADGDIVGPTIFGHNGAASVGSTAAVDYNDPTTPEYYSSRGPVTLYYQPTPGTAALASPEVLDKPDFAATDDVRSVFFGVPSGSVFRFAGTSAAAPQAAAIGALLREYDPALTPAQVMATLSATARPLATNGAPSDVGGGYLDAAAALADVAPLPGPPGIVSVANGNTRATVQWTPAAASPSFPVTGYVVTPILGGVSQAPVPVTAVATSQVIPGLTNGGFYTFTVAAVDANGEGPASAPSARMIIGQPGEPGPVVAAPGNASAMLRWAAPASYGLPITSYVVEVCVNGSVVTDRRFESAATKQTVTGLENGTTYTFAVSASNGSSSSPVTALSVPVRVGAPRAPSAVTATSGNGSAIVQWARPAPNGSAVTRYVIQELVNGVARGRVVVGAGKTSWILLHLALGHHYAFEVSADNRRGAGPFSSPSASIVVGAPGNPVRVSAQAVGNRARVHWSAPTDDGAAITSYTVTPYVASNALPASVFHNATTTQIVGGLFAGRRYTFRVAATNSRGTGHRSRPSNVVVVK